MFADNLKRLRKERDITQEKLAELVGVSRSAIGMYESGEREPDFETLEALADYLNVRMSDLIGENNQEPAEADPRIDMIYNLLKNMSDDNLMKLLDYARYLIAQQSQ